MDDQNDRRSGADRHEPTEGVRIIGAQEAAEAVERGDVAPRLPEAEPRFGDRPQAASSGARPALRFPLDADADPAALTRPYVLPQRLGAQDSTPSGSVELPHWTDPPTGEVPAVLIDEEAGSEDLDAWSSFATSSPNRWRDSGDDWDDTGDYAAALEDTEAPLGALDQRERPTDDELFSFDDVEEVAARRTAKRSAARARSMTGETQLFRGDDDPTLDEIADEPVFASGPASGSDEPPMLRSSRRNVTRQRGTARGADAGDGGGRDVPTAVAAGAAIGIAALICFVIGSAVVAALVTAVIAVAATEYFTSTQRAGLRPAALLGLVATISLAPATYWRGEAAVPLLIGLTVIFSLIWYLVDAGGDAPVTEGVGSTLVGVVWIGVLGSFATSLLRGSDGRGILLAIILATVAYDIGAFFVGRAFGQRPLSKASPNKTVEGVIGGVGVAAVIGLLLGGFNLGLPFHGFGHGLLMGIVVGIAATFGDLCESLIKRDLGVKDMGTLIPGHGGVLDRIDGLLFVLPAVYFLIIGMHWM